jgi:hypothetical protein
MTVNRPPTESRDPGLPDTEIDDGFAEAIAKVMGPTTLAAMVLPSGASDVRFPDRLPENIFPDWLPEKSGTQQAGFFGMQRKRRTVHLALLCSL